MVVISKYFVTRRLVALDYRASVWAPSEDTAALSDAELLNEKKKARYERVDNEGNEEEDRTVEEAEATLHFSLSSKIAHTVARWVLPRATVRPHSAAAMFGPAIAFFVAPSQEQHSLFVNAGHHHLSHPSTPLAKEESQGALVVLDEDDPSADGDVTTTSTRKGYKAPLADNDKSVASTTFPSSPSLTFFAKVTSALAHHHGWGAVPVASAWIVAAGVAVPSGNLATCRGMYLVIGLLHVLLALWVGLVQPHLARLKSILSAAAIFINAFLFFAAAASVGQSDALTARQVTVALMAAQVALGILRTLHAVTAGLFLFSGRWAQRKGWCGLTQPSTIQTADAHTADKEKNGTCGGGDSSSTSASFGPPNNRDVAVPAGIHATVPAAAAAAGVMVLWSQTAGYACVVLWLARQTALTPLWLAAFFHRLGTVCGGGWSRSSKSSKKNENIFRSNDNKLLNNKSEGRHTEDPSPQPQPPGIPLSSLDRYHDEQDNDNSPLDLFEGGGGKRSGHGNFSFFSDEMELQTEMTQRQSNEEEVGAAAPASAKTKDEEGEDFGEILFVTGHTNKYTSGRRRLNNSTIHEDGGEEEEELDPEVRRVRRLWSPSLAHSTTQRQRTAAAERREHEALDEFDRKECARLNGFSSVFVKLL